MIYLGKLKTPKLDAKKWEIVYVRRCPSTSKIDVTREEDNLLLFNKKMESKIIEKLATFYCCNQGQGLIVHAKA